MRNVAAGAADVDASARRALDVGAAQPARRALAIESVDLDSMLSCKMRVERKVMLAVQPLFKSSAQHGQCTVLLERGPLKKSPPPTAQKLVRLRPESGKLPDPAPKDILQKKMREEKAGKKVSRKRTSTETTPLG